MAFLEEDQNSQTQQTGQNGQSQISATAASAPVLSGSAGSTAPDNKAIGTGSASGAPTPSKSGSFVNLDAYLNANQGGALGDKLATNLGQEGDAAKGQLAQTQQSFNNQVQSGTTNYDQDFVNHALQDPNALVNNADQLGKVTAMRDATYSGPQSLTEDSGYAQSQQAIQNTNNDLNDTGTEAGRSTLLQNQFMTPTYSSGQQKLDGLLLQNDPTNQQTLSQVRQNYGNLSDMLNQAQTQSQQTAQQAAATDAATAKATRDAIQGADQQFQQSINDRVTQQQQAASDLYGQYQQSLKGGQDLTDDQLASLGATPEQAAQFHSLYQSSLPQLANAPNGTEVKAQPMTPSYDWASGITGPNVSQINAQDVATADDYAKYNALVQLEQSNPTFLNTGMANQAGTYQQYAQPKFTNLDQMMNEYANQYLASQGIAAPAGPGPTNSSEIPLITPIANTAVDTATNAIKHPVTNGLNPLSPGADLANRIGVGGSVGTAINKINEIANTPANVINSVISGGGGGGGKIICNELHRQGYISDLVIKLDEAYGQTFRKLNPEAYLGYLIVARPIVRAMKKSKVITHLVSYIALPWSQFMANKMDPSIPGSKLGQLINKAGCWALPHVYRIKKQSQLSKKLKA